MNEGQFVALNLLLTKLLKSLSLCGGVLTAKSLRDLCNFA